MKKALLLIITMLGLVVSTFARKPIEGNLHLAYKVINPIGEHKTLPKSPVMAPEVYLDGDTLYFDEALEGCTVQLVDEDETIVFTEFIEENQTSLTFPATLTGTFVIEVVRADQHFQGEIEL